MTDWQQNILVGTVLGGSSLVKPPSGVNYYLSMRDTDLLWLSYKTQELSEYFGEKQPILDGKTYRFNSYCSEELTKLHDSLYDGHQRRLTEEVLLPIRDIGFAVWFIDSGGQTGRNKKNVYLNSTKIGKTGTDLIVGYFQEMGITCKPSISNNRMRVLFSVEGSIQFLKIVAHRIPDCVLSKTIA